MACLASCRTPPPLCRCPPAPFPGCVQVWPLACLMALAPLYPFPRCAQVWPLACLMAPAPSSPAAGENLKLEQQL